MLQSPSAVNRHVFTTMTSITRYQRMIQSFTCMKGGMLNTYSKLVYKEHNNSHSFIQESWSNPALTNPFYMEPLAITNFSNIVIQILMFVLHFQMLTNSKRKKNQDLMRKSEFLVWYHVINVLK